MLDAALIDLDRLGPGRTRLSLRFAVQPDGTPATFPLIVLTGAQPGPTAALVAGIHGDEYEGPAALLDLADRIEPEGLAGRLLIVPFANLAAFGAGTRTSPIDGQNLARIFPGDAGGTLSHRLAHALFETVVARADVLIDCHSGGVRLAFLDVAGFYAADDRITEAVARASLDLACDLNLAHLWRLPARAGVLSFEAARRGIAVTGAEVGGRGGAEPRDAALYRDGIRHVLARRGMIEARDLPPRRTYATCLDGDWALAPVGGFIEPLAPLGAKVRAGDPLAAIRSPLGETLATLLAETDGLVMGVRHLRSIWPGEWATCAVRECPL